MLFMTTKHLFENLLIAVWLLVNTFAANSQQNEFTYCQNVPDWENFIVDTSGVSSKADVLIVTNRPYLPEQSEFLPNDIAQWRKVSYFTAYCADSSWHLSKVESFQEGMDMINSGEDVVLFVHGHGKGFPSTLTRASQIQLRYGVKTILFDWPSQNSNFNKSMARVRRCGENFYNLLLQLEDYKVDNFKTDQKLSVFAHSLGNYFLTHLVVNGNSQYLNRVFVDNIVFNAPAVKSNDHSKVLSQLNFQNNIYVALNENDRVLRGAHLITYGKMLGNYVVPPLATNTEYVHFTPLVEKQHTYFGGYHLFEYTNAALFDFYSEALHGETVNFNQPGLYQIRELGDGYSIVP